jgi:TonB family protein
VLKNGPRSAVLVAFVTLAAAPQPSPTPVVYRVGGDVKAPILLKKVEPHFRQDHVEHQLGVLIVEGIIGSNGKIRDLKIQKGPKNSFAREALVAMRQWEYKPATRRGVPVDVYLTITVSDFPMEPDA